MRILWGDAYKKEKAAEERRYVELEKQYRAAQEELEAKRKIDIDGKSQVITPGASSSKDLPTTYDFLKKSLNIIKPDFDLDCIPVIRKLCKTNANFSQIIKDLIRLANTGHKIKFNQEIPDSQVESMRNYIETSSKHWHVGAGGVNGVVNKMFRQLFQGGAVSCEWIPNADLDDIEELRFINPENIRFVAEKNSKGYQPYQKVVNRPLGTLLDQSLKKLNTSQYKYLALDSDGDLPYGIPPFLAALDPTRAQKDIQTNLDFILKQLGAFGYMDAKMAKPSPEPGESKEKYVARLQGLLTRLKDVTLQAMKDGVQVGFIDDHEFTFNNNTKDAQGLKDIIDIVEAWMAQGLGTDPIFMGRGEGSETMVTIMFSKMIAQLRNIQDVVRENLEFGYRLLLTLGGYKFKTISVEFNPSTITDDLKYQQAMEIKIRNLSTLYMMGIIGQDQFADGCGYIKPDQAKPRVDINDVNPATGEVKRKKREDDKNKSDRKVRDKNAPRGKVRQNNDSEPGGAKIISIS